MHQLQTAKFIGIATLVAALAVVTRFATGVGTADADQRICPAGHWKLTLERVEVAGGIISDPDQPSKRAGWQPMGEVVGWRATLDVDGLRDEQRFTMEPVSCDTAVTCF